LASTLASSTTVASTTTRSTTPKHADAVQADDRGADALGGERALDSGKSALWAGLMPSPTDRPNIEERHAAAERVIEAGLRQLAPVDDRALLLIVILSGGSNDTTSISRLDKALGNRPYEMRASNRANILRTWADEHTWFVTIEDVDTTRVIHLDRSYEDAGYSGLAAKMRATWVHLHDAFLPKYKWFMKVCRCGFFLLFLVVWIECVACHAHTPF
jgi:hypothetical protein